MEGLPPTLDDPVGAASAFLENKGQLPDDDVGFYASLGSGGIAFAESRVLLNVEEPPGHDRPFLKVHRGGPREAPLVERAPEPPPSRKGCTIALEFVGARTVEPVGREALPWESNFFLGSDPSRWRTGVLSYEEVAFEGLYEGIDLVYRLGPSGIKYEFVVSPGVDPDVIEVGVRGHEGLDIREGALVVSTAAGEILDSGVLAFYADAPEELVRCSFELRGPDCYGFHVPAYDRERVLVIDPLVYSTFLGGGDYEEAYGLRVDDEGSAYITGYVESRDFPTTAGAYDDSINGFVDGFVTKMAANGSAIVWSTYLGGNDEDCGYDLDLDASGNVYVGGMSGSSDFPVTPGAYQRTRLGGYYNAFVTKLSSDGRSLRYSTYLGGGDFQYIMGIAVDAGGDAYVSGRLYSYGGGNATGFPTTQGAFQTIFKGGYVDGFITRFNAAGSDLKYSTLLGGMSSDYITAIDIDASGCAHVAGYTQSSDFPVTPGAFRSSLSGRDEGFVSKMAPDGTALRYSTMLGGSDSDAPMDLVVDGQGRAFIGGYTQSADFPTTTGAYQTSSKGNYDGFVTQLSVDGRKALNSTYLGGSDSDFLYGIDIDPSGNVVVGGNTASALFPTTPRAAQTTHDGEYDSFVSKLVANFTELSYSTFLGGSGWDYNEGVRALGEWFVYACGGTDSRDFPLKNAYQTALRGGYDIFVSKLTMDSLPPKAVAGDDVVIDQHETVQFNGSGSSDNIGVSNWTWTFKYDGEDVVLYNATARFTFHTAGGYDVTLTVKDISGHKGRDYLHVTVRDITLPVADAGMNRVVRQHATVVFDGKSSSDNVGVVNWTWNFSYGGSMVVLYGPTPSFTFDEAGEYHVSLRVRDAAGNNATDDMVVKVHDITPPVADAGDDLVVDQHDVVRFLGNRSWDNVGIVNWTWSFVHGGEPVTLYGPGPSYRFDHAGEYVVVLTIRDAEGFTDIDTMTIEVRDTTAPVADAGPDKAVNQGQTVGLDAEGSTDNVGIAGWAWTFVYDGEPVELSGPTPSFLFELAGEYEITLTASDAMGNQGTDVVVVTVIDITDPEADAGPDLTVDQHQTVGFDGSASTDNVGVAGCTWRFVHAGEEHTLDGITASFVFEEAGVYEVTMTVLDAMGNSDVDHVEVTVRDTTPPVAVAGDDQTVDQYLKAEFDGSASTDNVGIEEWQWSFEYDGLPAVLEGRVQSFGFDFPGVYEVTLTVTDLAGNSANASLTVTVRDTTRPFARAQGDLTVDAGGKVTFDGSASSDNVGVVRWVWTFKEGGRTVELEGATVEHTFDEAGEYDVTLTVYDADGNLAFQTFTVTVEGTGWPVWAAVVAVVAVAAIVAIAVLRRRSAGGGDAEEG